MSDRRVGGWMVSQTRLIPRSLDGDKKTYDENVDNYTPAQYLSTNSQDALQF